MGSMGRREAGWHGCCTKSPSPDLVAGTGWKAGGFIGVIAKGRRREAERTGDEIMPLRHLANKGPAIQPRHFSHRQHPKPEEATQLIVTRMKGPHPWKGCGTGEA